MREGTIMLSDKSGPSLKKCYLGVIYLFFLPKLLITIINFI